MELTNAYAENALIWFTSTFFFSLLATVITAWWALSDGVNVWVPVGCLVLATVSGTLLWNTPDPPSWSNNT